MLDPGTARELKRLTAALEAARESLKQKDEEIAALGFSKESKQGRLLMARFRTLSRENEEFGAQVSQGRLHALQTEITLLREQLTALKQKHADLAATSAALSAENDALQLRCLGAGAGVAAAPVVAKDANAMDEAEPPAAAAAEEGAEAAAAAPAARGKRARRGD
jgi:predicted  nucleic acid-binding Zn-ribbon protein